MAKKLSKAELQQKSFENFINSYKWKDEEQMIYSLLEIKTSNISQYEYQLHEALRSENLNNNSISTLYEMKNILTTLISNTSPSKEFLTPALQRVESALEKK